MFDVDDEAGETRFGEWLGRVRWSLLPSLLGLFLIVTVTGGAIGAARSETLRRALLAPDVLPFTAGLAALVALAGAGLAVTGLVLDRVARDRSWYQLTQEGLIEEVSQEFHKVRDAIDETDERVATHAGRLSRVASATSRLEAARVDHEARIAELEARALGRREVSVTLKPTARGSPDAIAPLAAESNEKHG